MMYNYGFYSPFHFLFTVVGWMIVIAIFLLIVRGGRRDNFMHRMHHKGLFRDPGMNTLRERFAKGEITKEEFEEKKKALES